MASAWGTSWGTAWGNSWGAAAVGEDALAANDVTSASSVSQPAVKQLHVLLANDITSASSVGQPALHQAQSLAANDVTSASYVSQPALGEIAPGIDGLLAEDIVSASYVSIPTLVVDGGVVIPPEPIPLPPGGGAGGGGGAYRKAWQKEFDRRRAREEGLTLREYLERVTEAPLSRRKDRDAVAKASQTVREALGRAESVEGVEYGPRLTEALSEAARAAAEANRQAVVLQMRLAEQAALLFLQRLAEAELQRRAMEIEQMLYDDALATVLLLSA